MFVYFWIGTITDDTAGDIICQELPFIADDISQIFVDCKSIRAPTPKPDLEYPQRKPDLYTYIRMDSSVLVGFTIISYCGIWCCMFRYDQVWSDMFWYDRYVLVCTYMILHDPVSLGMFRHPVMLTYDTVCFFINIIVKCICTLYCIVLCI